MVKFTRYFFLSLHNNGETNYETNRDQQTCLTSNIIMNYDKFSKGKTEFVVNSNPIERDRIDH